ncbi:hypothetical protein ONZ45_g106 [Pleurotus djamor]|nr:hypothetical protein ONZ45_g106 [Pleurotus djamor]
MPYRKQIIPVQAQLVSFDTDIPPAVVLARLDKHLNRDQADQLIPTLIQSKTKDDITKGVNSLLKESGFLYFSSLPHHNWLRKYYQSDFPVTVTYTIGNPLVAQTIIQEEPRAAAQIPPRILVLGKADGSGTSIVYHLPSSIMQFEENQELKEALEALDAKLEKFVVDFLLSDTEWEMQTSDGEPAPSETH